MDSPSECVMPFDRLPGFTKRDRNEGERFNMCSAEYLIVEFRREGDYLQILDSPDHGLFAFHHTMHDVLGIYFIDELESLLPLVPSLLNTNWEVAEYNAELVTEKFDTQLPEAVTALGE